MNSLAVSFNAKDQYSQFVSTLAHEIRNPLANIDLSAAMLRAGPIPTELNEYIDIIIRNSKRINALVFDLLTYKHSAEIQAKEYSLCQLVDEVLELVGDSIKLKNITVDKKYDCQGLKVVLDGPKMKIALANVVINAVESTATAKGVLKLSIKAEKGKLVLQIEDNGCGMSKQNLASLFTTSFTNKPGGLGLGLPIVYDTLRSNQVGINVESEENKGTRFTFLFDKTN